MNLSSSVCLLPAISLYDKPIQIFRAFSSYPNFVLCVSQVSFIAYLNATKGRNPCLWGYVSYRYPGNPVPMLPHYIIKNVLAKNKHKKIERRIKTTLI